MLIFIYGEDSFRTRHKVVQMKRAFKEKFDSSNMNMDQFPQEGGSLKPENVLQTVRSFPFMGDKRMVVVRGLIENTNKDGQDVWVDGISDMPDSTILILWENMSVKSCERKSIFKELNKLDDTHSYKFPTLDFSGIKKWVRGRFQRLGVSIERDALDELANRVGSDLWQMSSSVDKLAAFAGDRSVTKSMVKKLVLPTFEGQIFDLMDAISKRNSKKALRLLDEERSSGANDFYLMHMLARQVRILLSVKSLIEERGDVSNKQIASDLGLHPFVVKKTKSQSRNFSMETLRAAHEFLFNCDLQAKTGLIDADFAVDTTTANLLTEF